MLRYFTSRACSEKLGINLARWKRWSRTFLAPDPLGGQQSGYARQFSIDQVLTVYLGGVLISELKFSLSEAQQILSDLKKWLSASGIYLHAEPDPELIQNQLGLMHPCLMLIGYVMQSQTGLNAMGYGLYGKAADSHAVEQGSDSRCIPYHCFPIEGLPFIESHQDWTFLRVLNISRFLKNFAEALGIDARLYPSEFFTG